MAAIQALQQWCRQQCEGYKDVHITNMTTSFRDGLAFCAILHRHRPELINFNSLSKGNVFENNQLAFRVAEEELGIPALLDAEDMVALKVPDRLSILTYVSQYYNYFHGRSPIGGMSGIKRPPSKASEEPSGKKVVSEPVTPSPAKTPRPHLPVEAKTGSALPGHNLVKEHPPEAARRVLAESSNVRSSSCAICGGHVHLVQRLLMDGKLYHRNCFRCKQCSSTLHSGNYKPGSKPGTFICNRHEPPSRLPNSSPVSARAVTGQNLPTSTTSTWGSPVKRPELKTPLQESVNPDQVLKSGGAIQVATRGPSRPGNHKSSSDTGTPSSRWLDSSGNKPDPRAGAALPSPSNWTPSSAKTQQAREKFFQSNAETSGLPTDKADPVKNQASPFSAPHATGKGSTSVTNASGIISGVSEKDRARTFLMHALPGPQSSTSQQGNFSGASPRSLVANMGTSSPPSSSQQHLPTKKITSPASVLSAMEKPEKGPLKTVPTAHHSPQEAGKKVGFGTTTPNIVKDHAVISRPPESERKRDVKVSKVGGGSAEEEKAESPADWRSRLKPVANKVSKQGDIKTSQKPAEVVVNIIPSTEEKGRKPVSPVTSPATQDTALSADQSQKKKRLMPNLDLLGDWQKPRQQWEDVPAAPEVADPGQPKRAVAPVKPSPPRTFQNLPNSQLVSPSKLRPDYVPEEEIQKEVQQIERDLDELEHKGVEMEKQLRGCEGDETEDTLMVEWFKLIHEKQLLLRRESELMHKANQQKLEEKQWDIESELRHLMDKSDFLKSSAEKAREKELLDLYVATVNDRNQIVENLDEDRLREQEEDEVLAAMIQRCNVPRDGPRINPEGEKKAKGGFFKMLKLKH
ncbi:MICAL-like protein 2 isoform X3 [Hemicordylus capensis]|uniref:MICAL-like protein 2 isoform X3 n=1 Tax=Hemicordylus capensis TaxID=884348 RepID=UPI0023022C43|nr:MICAL-like protein 2 isoform X3 [Hemicordylus capensis]